MEPVVNYDHKTIQMRRGTTAEWRRYGAICIPAEGEICVEFFQEADGSRNGNVGIKVGNGTNSYTSLPYLVTNQNQDDRISDEQINNWDLTVEKLANLTAAEVAQDNASLGDNVQEALNDLHSRLLAIDPDGGSIEINDIPGLEDALNDKADQSALDKEIQDRKDGDKALQDQIDALDPNANGDVDWADIENKPTEFPPEAHNQGWDTITGKPADYPPSAHDHAWSEITGKPSEFPPETHGHEIADVDGLQDALDSAGGTPAWDDVTGKPTEFPPAAHNQDWSTITNTPSEYPPEAHTHGQDEVDGLELRLDAIEGSISSGGGFVDAPNDGKLYGRQSEAWAEVPSGGASSWNDLTDKPTEFPPAEHTHEIDDVDGLQDALDAAGGAPAWDDVTGKPADFPPSAHNHDGVYQPVGDYIGEAPNDGEEYARKNEGWVKLQDHNYTGADAVKLTGDQSAAGHKTWTGLATFGQRVAFRDSVNGDTSANFGEDVTARSFIKSGGTSDQYLMADGSVSVGSSSNTVEGTWAYNASTAGNGEWTSRNTNWLNITTVTLNKSDATGYEHNFVLMNAGDVMFIQAPSGGGEFNITEKTVSGETTTFTLDPIASYGSFPSAGDSTQINFIPQVSAGSNVTIGPNPPDPALEGMQWLEVPATPGEEATMWVYDGAKWLQHPGGKDGKDGANGLDGLWTDNGDGSISYSNVTVADNDMMAIGRTPTNNGMLQLNVGSGGNCNIAMGEAGTEKWFFGNTSGSDNFRFYNVASGAESMTIGADGRTTVGGVFSVQDRLKMYVGNAGAEVALSFYETDGTEAIRIYSDEAGAISFWDGPNGINRMKLDSSGHMTVYGNIYKQGGTPVIATGDMIKAFSKLRNAVKDEETVESLKESITNWIGGMIEEWESMQSAATQEINNE